MANQIAIASLVETVKSHAKCHYDSKGYSWDTIVECYDDTEIEYELVTYKVTSKKAAISHFAGIAKMFYENDHEANAQFNSGWNY